MLQRQDQKVALDHYAVLYNAAQVMATSTSPKPVYRPDVKVKVERRIGTWVTD